MKRTHSFIACQSLGVRGSMLMLAASVAVAAMVIASISAHAVSQRVKNACKNDYYRHCPSHAIGSPQLRTCMTQAGKRKQLSRRCLRALIDTGEVPRKYLKRRL
ncbi:MAG: hypothetical protein K0U34_07115 [Alphaproteobacteria bacterium]|nr:hypothetical protein [Alphaproteobacteria bacterium]